MNPEEQLQNASIKTVPGAAETVREQDKIMLVLAYLGIFALIPLLTVKDSEYVKWHAKNGLVLSVGGGIAITILAAIPLIQFLAVCLAAPALMVLCVMGIVKALNGVRWRIPVVSDLADKL